MFAASRRTVLAVAALVATLGIAQAVHADLVPGNLVVTRIGNGVDPLPAAGAGTSVYLDQYSSGAAPAGSIALPTSGADAFVLSSTGEEAGHLTRSVDRQSLVIAGYNAAIGTAGVAGLDPSVAPRTVAVIKANGSYDLTTKLTDPGAWPKAATESKYVRGVATTDGTKFWFAGDSDPTIYPAGGTRFATLGSSTSVALNDPARAYVNVRSAQIFGGQFYTTSGSSSVGKGVQTVGTGLPESGPATITTFATDGNSVNQMFMFDLTGDGSLDTMYTIGKNFAKYALVGGSWTKTGTFASGELQYMAADATANGVDVYIGGYSSIYHFLDTNGYNQPFSFSTMPAAYLTAPTNEQFRGIAFAPVPEPASLVLMALGGLVAIFRRR